MFGLGIVEIVIVLLVLAMLLAVPVALIAIVVLLVRGRVVDADEQVARGRRHQVVVSVLAAMAAAAAVPLCLVVAAALTWLVCRSITTRPTIASDLEGDAVLRRAAAGRALRWLAWGLAATAAGDLLIAGGAVQQAPGWDPAGTVMVGAGIALA